MKKILLIVTISLVLVGAAVPVMAGGWKQYLPPPPPPGIIFSLFQEHQPSSYGYHRYPYERNYHQERMWIPGHWEYWWERDYLRGRHLVKVWIPGHWERW